MTDFATQRCPISGSAGAHRVFVYDSPPPGEVGFQRAAGEPYHREVWQFSGSNHFVSTHCMAVAHDYTGDYVDATYRDAAGMVAAFERVISLPPERSDNAGRVAAIRAFAQHHFGRAEGIRLLDVGAGLGVFPYAITRAGWACTALDPDPRATQHISATVGVPTVCADFMQATAPERFEVVTFNKVLEHVADPIAMLRRTHEFVERGGFVYVELPDGEMAARAGADREEFFIEHLHVFSFASIVLLASRAGFDPNLVERVREPSGKFTLRAFLTRPDARVRSTGDFDG